MPTGLATLLRDFMLLPEELHARAAGEPPGGPSVTFAAEVRAPFERGLGGEPRGLHFRLTITTERPGESAAVEADTVAFRVVRDAVLDLRLERSGALSDPPRSLPLSPEGVARLLAEVRAFCEAALPGGLDLG